MLVAEDGHLKVTDFGIARAGAASDMTEAGSVIGTAQYLSPEQARGDEVTAASDCYAVGIVLYEMLTGRVPFDGGPPVAVAMKQISDEPVSPRIVEPSVPRELEAVVLRALAKRPSERYRTAEEMSRALAEVRGLLDGTGGTTRVMPVAGPATGVMGPTTGATRVGPPPPPASAPPRRRRWPMIAGILVVLLAIAAGAFVFFSGDEAKAVTMPPVAGQSAADAERSLRDLGLEVDVRRVIDPNVEEGKAIDTDPAAGQEAHEGDTVILRVSAGPGDTPVPDVTDKTVDDADRAPSSAGLHGQGPGGGERRRQRGPRDPVRPGRGRERPEGQRGHDRGLERPGTGRGAEPARGQPGDGRAAHPRRGPRGRLDHIAGEPAAEGTVIAQTPGATAMVDRGSRVNLVIAAAQTTIQVPDVVGNLATDANFKLTNAGFVVTSDTAASDQPVGEVIDQTPLPA